MQRRLANFVTYHPGAAVGVVLALIVAAAAGVAVRGVKFDFTPQALFSSFEDQQAIDARFRAQFGSTENVALLLVQADDVVALAPLQTIHALTVALSGKEYAARVESITVASLPRNVGEGELNVEAPIDGDTVEPEEAAALRAALAESTLLDGHLVGAERHLAVVAVFLADGYDLLSRLEPAIDDIRAVVDAQTLPDGVTVELAGLPHIRTYMIACFRRDQVRLIPLSMLICGVTLWLTFRWLAGVLLPLMAVGVSAALVVGGMAWFGEPFNIINQVVPTLIIIIGISDSIHLVARFGEEARQHERRVATHRTVGAMAAACLLTSLTTAIGFGSLATSHTAVLRNFGVTAATGVMLAYVVTILVIPVALGRVRPPRHSLEGHDDGWMARLTEWCVVFSMRKAKAVAVVTLAITAGLVWYSRDIVIDTRLMEAFQESDPVVVQTRLIERELNGVLPIEVMLESPTPGRFDDAEVLNAVYALQRAIEADPHVLATRSYGDLLHHTWAAYANDPSKLDAPFRSRAQVVQLASLLEGGRPDPIAPYVGFERQHLRVSVLVPDIGSRAALTLGDDIRAMAATHLGGLGDVTVALSGDAYSGSRGLDSLIRDMATSLALAVVVIFGIMALLFRSVRMGLISVPANVIPLVGAAAYMAVRGLPLNTTTVIIFSVALGLAVDDTIHLMARYREERLKGLGIDEAMRASGRGSGQAVIITSVMLASGMSVMFLSAFNPVRLFGEIIATTLGVCLVADLLVLPATLKLFGGKDGGVDVSTAPEPGA